MVLEWTSAETGVGSSMADGSHGWSLNCADLPVAAIRSPISGTMFGLSIMKICYSSQELDARMKPMSPMWF